MPAAPLELTWKRAFKVWWSLFWRWTLVMILGGFVLSSVFSALAGAEEAVLRAEALDQGRPYIAPDQAGKPGGALYYFSLLLLIFGSGWGMVAWVLKRVNYSDFTLALWSQNGEIEVTWKRSLKCWGSFLWRYLAMGSVWIALVFILGYTYAFTVGPEAQKMLPILMLAVTLIGYVVWFFLGWTAIRLMYKKPQYEDFELALVPLIYKEAEEA